MRPRQSADVLLVCAGGGHLTQLLALRRAWERHSRVWVTDLTSVARWQLRGENVEWAPGPTHRDLSNGIHRIALAWLRNLVLAWRVVRRARPRVVLTTGGAVAVPYAWVARVRRARVVYVESLTRIDEPSLSYRLIAPVADRVYVQWPELAAAVPGARYLGSILADR